MRFPFRRKKQFKYSPSAFIVSQSFVSKRRLCFLCVAVCTPSPSTISNLPTEQTNKLQKGWKQYYLNNCYRVRKRRLWIRLLISFSALISSKSKRIKSLGSTTAARSVRRDFESKSENSNLNSRVNKNKKQNNKNKMFAEF